MTALNILKIFEADFMVLALKVDEIPGDIFSQNSDFTVVTVLLIIRLIVAENYQDIEL